MQGEEEVERVMEEGELQGGARGMVRNVYE